MDLTRIRSTRSSADFVRDDQNDGQIHREADQGDGERDHGAHFSHILECFDLSFRCYVAVAFDAADVVHVAVFDFVQTWLR